MMKLKQNNQGFTIIELLIGTAVFSIVLLISSAAVIGLSRQFYKGLHKSKTQEVARSISEEIAKNIQYSKSPPMPLTGGPAGVTSICIANNTYSYRTGVQLSSGPSDANNTASNAVLLRSAGCGTPDATWARDADETELIGEGMRLSAFDITHDAAQKVYQIRVKVVAGIDVMLTDPTGPNASCRSNEGQQFCAASDFTLIVVRNM